MRTSLASLASLALLTAASGLAVAAAPSAPTSTMPRATSVAQPTGDIVYIYSAGLAEMLSSPKDQGLRNALSLVEGRLVELARMSGDMPDPEKTINTIWTLAASPMTLRLAATEGGEDGAPPVALELRSRPADAAALERTIVSLLRTGEVRTRTTPGGREFDTPAGVARFGLTENDRSLSLSLGEPLPPADMRWDLPDGYTPIFGVHANLRNAQPLLEMALSQAPDSEQVRPMLEQSGVLGDDALVLDMAVGHNARESILRGTLHDVRPRATMMGIPADVTLDRGFLALIPADATYVSAGIFDLSMLDQFLEIPDVQQGLGQVNDQFGINVVDDILHQIGNRFAIYQSDRTGGGGMLSMVAILELESGEQFGRAHRRLVDAANDFADQQSSGRPGEPTVEIRSRRIEGMEFFTLTWPGLPIPAEISWTIHDNHLMLALSPRSLVEAMSQASQEGASFADNPMLAQVAGRANPAAADLISVSYTDAPRFAVQGYSLVNLFCAGLSNALRTQDGPDPGIPLPAFNTFIAGIQPSVMLSFWEGDDLVMRGRADSSILVNLAGSSGAALGPMAIAGSAGALIPALQKARESAVQVKAQANLRHIAVAAAMYSADNSDRLPPSFDALAPYLDTGEPFTSPYGPCYDGSPDYAVRTDMAKMSMGDLMYPSQTLAAIDRASVLNGAEMTLVAYFDGHVEAIYTWQLTDLLTQDSNRGAFEAFALPDWLNPGF